MLVSVAPAGIPVIAAVEVQFKVSVPKPPLIASREVNVPAGALNVSLLTVATGASTPVVSGQIKPRKISF